MQNARAKFNSSVRIQTPKKKVLISVVVDRRRRGEGGLKKKQNWQCKKTVSENQKEIYNMFTFSTKATQKALYYAEWTFRTIRYCSDRESHANFPPRLK